MYKTSGASPEGRDLRKLGAARDPSWRPAVPFWWRARASFGTAHTASEPSHLGPIFAYRA